MTAQTPCLRLGLEAEAPSFFQFVIETSSDMVSRHAPDGTYRYVSPACTRLLGYEPDEVIGRSAYDFFHPEDLAAIQRSHETILEQPVVYTVAYRIRRKDGGYVWFETTSHLVSDASGQVLEIHATSRDITQRVEAERQLRESEERFKGAFDCAAIGMALVSLAGEWLRVNRALCALTGYTEAELLATTFQAITHPDDLDEDLRYVAEMIQGSRRSYQMEKRYFHKQGQIIWIQLSVSMVRDIQGDPLYFVAQIQDITAHRRAHEALRRQAKQDALTHLDNHGAFHSALDDELSRVTPGDPLSLVLIDLDYFKRYNDSLGHPAGDVALRSVAAILRASIRGSDYAARYGGEEFAIILPQTDCTAAMAVAERIRAAIAATPWEVPLTASIGVATTAAQLRTNAELVAAADRALYASKHGGRNRVTHSRKAERLERAEPEPGPATQGRPRGRAKNKQGSAQASGSARLEVMALD